MNTNTLIQVSGKELKEWAQQGWSLFHNKDTDQLEVQRIDDPKDWENVHGYPVSELEDDTQAVELARKYFVLDGFAVVRRIEK